MSGSEIALTVICVGLVGLCGFIFWMWHQDKKLCHRNKTEEAKRLYAWLDDILDRIDADDAERYALCRRIKYEIPQTVKKAATPNIPNQATEDKTPPLFVQGKRR